MSSPCEVTAPSTAAAPMSFFERYLTAWVALCIVIGIAQGQAQCHRCVGRQRGEFMGRGEGQAVAVGLPLQAVVAQAKPDFCITHAPGAMLITDLLNHQLASF